MTMLITPNNNKKNNNNRPSKLHQLLTPKVATVTKLFICLNNLSESMSIFNLDTSHYRPLRVTGMHVSTVQVQRTSCWAIRTTHSIMLVLENLLCYPSNNLWTSTAQMSAKGYCEDTTICQSCSMCIVYLWRWCFATAAVCETHYLLNYDNVTVSKSSNGCLKTHLFGDQGALWHFS